MKVIYDKPGDTVYIQLKKGKYDHTKKITDAILVDMTKNNDILGVEILDASENIEVLPEKNVSIEKKSSYQSASVLHDGE
jgi:uncharacterized protein YuzE